MRVLDTHQMREADRRTIEDVGVPSRLLMEKAGREVVAAMQSTWPELSTMRVAILCGRGNNGGDGFVAARTLSESGTAVDVYLLGRAADVAGDARLNLESCLATGLDVVELADPAAWEQRRQGALACDVIVDAMFGTGFRGPLSGVAATIVEDLNQSGRPVVAVDLPSGLSADSEQVPGPAVRAAMTVTLAAPKISLLLPPAEALVGRLVVADIGIPASVIDALSGPIIELLAPTALRTLVRPRPRDSHKGSYGHVLILAGSPGKSGAAHLAAMAALRSGAGLVTVATPGGTAPVVAALGAEYMTLPLDEASDGTIADSAIGPLLDFDADVIAAGPGLGRSASVRAVVQALVARATVPLVLDADALVAFADDTDRLIGRETAATIVTPHPGEMARITGLSVGDVQQNRLEIARTYAAAHRLHVVLKGHRTVVASPDGGLAINSTGNPGMASGGTGDVLLGAIAAWLGQLRDADAAARLGVYLHGLAGDLAAAETGETALIAGDVVGHLGGAVRELCAAPARTPRDRR